MRINATVGFLSYCLAPHLKHFTKFKFKNLKIYKNLKNLKNFFKTSFFSQLYYYLCYLNKLKNKTWGGALITGQLADMAPQGLVNSWKL